MDNISRMAGQPAFVETDMATGEQYVPPAQPAPMPQMALTEPPADLAMQAAPMAPMTPEMPMAAPEAAPGAEGPAWYNDPATMTAVAPAISALAGMLMGQWNVGGKGVSAGQGALMGTKAGADAAMTGINYSNKMAEKQRSSEEAKKAAQQDFAQKIYLQDRKKGETRKDLPIGGQMVSHVLKSGVWTPERKEDGELAVTGDTAKTKFTYEQEMKEALKDADLQREMIKFEEQQKAKDSAALAKEGRDLKKQLEKEKRDKEKEIEMLKKKGASEGQTKSKIFYDQALEAEQIIERLKAKGFDPGGAHAKIQILAAMKGGTDESGALKTTASVFLSQDAKEYLTAVRYIAASHARKVSGAVLSENELLQAYKSKLPNYKEPEESREAKKRNRMEDLETYKAGAGWLIDEKPQQQETPTAGIRYLRNKKTGKVIKVNPDGTREDM